MAKELNPTQLETLKAHNCFEKWGQDKGIWVDRSHQVLYLIQNNKILIRLPCSTAKAGLGQKENSFQTPKGWHEIAEKIGETSPVGAVFSSRQPTGEVWNKDQISENDLILSRILWLRGLEPGLNAGPGIDSHQRFIYIHGSNHIKTLGQEASMGCVRLDPFTMIAFFNQVCVGTKLLIS